jgi:uncharacterized protein
MLKKLDKNINKYHLIIRTIGSSLFYIGLIIVILIPKDEFGVSMIKYIVIALLGLLVSILLVFNFVIPFYVYSLYGYQIHSDYVMIQKGVLIRSQDYIPIKRIQHIEKFQGPIQSLFKISTIRIFTAGSNDFIVGISSDIVDDIVHQIREQLQVYLDSERSEKDES